MTAPVMTLAVVMETKSLTYDELGQALGITAASAKRLAIRRRWLKAIGNDGKTRVTVPVERLEAAKRAADDDTKDTIRDDPSDAASAPTSDVTGDMIQILNRHIQRLETEIDSLRAERDTERTRATQVEMQLEVLRAVLDLEKKQSSELRQDRDALRQERDRLFERVMEPPSPPEPKNGFLDRLRRAFG